MSLPPEISAPRSNCRNTHVNNTLHEKGKNIELEPISFPHSNMSMAIESLKKGEEEKLSVALHQLLEEDPTVKNRILAGA